MIENDVDVNESGAKYWSSNPIEEIIKRNNIELLKMLLRTKKIRAPKFSENTPYGSPMYTAVKNYNDDELINLLLDNGYVLTCDLAETFLREKSFEIVEKYIEKNIEYPINFWIRVIDTKSHEPLDKFALSLPYGKEQAILLTALAMKIKQMK